MKKNPHAGSNFDDFLKEEGIFAEAEAMAIKRVISYQIEQAMKKKENFQIWNGEQNVY